MVRFKFAASTLLAISLLASAATVRAEEEEGGGAKQLVICIDPGHQQTANLEPEPVAPGAAETKPKVSAGTRGVVTKKPEYVLTLEVSERLKEKLEALGYKVVMTRDRHDVDVSNRERAEIANQAEAALFLRIHADGDASSRTQGMSVLYPSADSPAAAIAEPSERAAREIIAAMVRETDGAPSRGAVPRSDLTGFNWSRMPTVLVEMGFMTNPEEDRLLSEPDYQDWLAAGMAAGTDRFVRGAQAAEPQVRLDTELHLTNETALYAAPSADAAPAARLAPQDVHADARRGAWYRIATWLGPMWLFSPMQ